MENTEIPSLGSQLLALKTEHRQLDLEIDRLQDFPYIDQLQLQRLKKQKIELFVAYLMSYLFYLVKEK